jgi:hypothetical protein
MTKTEALELLRSGIELTEEQRTIIAEAIESAEIDDDWDAWESSNCW